MLIGLTGRNAAGKGEVARYLQKKSFYYYSLSDAIRDEIRSRGEEPTRDRLIIVGNELRQRYGANVLAERTLAKIEDDKHYVIDSIRNPAEVDALLLKLLKEVQRPSWDEYFMNIAKVVASRSNCMKRKVAAIIIRDKRVVSTGYNGTPRGTRNCNEGGCPRCNSLAISGTALDECLCSHGEENAIVQASYHGVSLKDAIIYTTFAPCLQCSKMIINSGIREVIYNLEYPLNDSAFRLFQQAGVFIRKLKVDA